MGKKRFSGLAVKRFGARGFLCFHLTVQLFNCSTASFLWAVSVNRVQVAPRRGVLIATVDLDKVFQAYPGTKKAKEDLERLVLLKENEIAAKRAEIFRLTEELARLRATPALTPSLPGFVPASVALDTASVQGSTEPSVATPVAPSAPIDSRLETMEGQIKTKKKELRKIEKDAEKNLEDLEEAKTKTLLAKIYFSLRELAEEKNVDMIVDKNAILWGSSRLDLTDDLMRRLKSAMIEAE